MGNSEERRRERRERLRIWKQWITSFGEGADRKAKFYLLAALVPTLLFAGLPMVGVSINLPLGAGLLASAFFLSARCLWFWEGLSKYHVILRWLTVIMAGIGYFWWVGGLIVTEYRKEQAGHGQTIEGLIRALPDVVALRVMAALTARDKESPTKKTDVATPPIQPSPPLVSDPRKANATTSPKPTEVSQEVQLLE